MKEEGEFVLHKQEHLTLPPPASCCLSGVIWKNQQSWLCCSQERSIVGIFSPDTKLAHLHLPAEDPNKCTFCNC